MAAPIVTAHFFYDWQAQAVKEMTTTGPQGVAAAHIAVAVGGSQAKAAEVNIVQAAKGIKKT
jgi:hypothetical protein